MMCAKTACTIDQALTGNRGCEVLKTGYRARRLEKRMACWRGYHERLASLERDGLLRRPIIPADCHHNAHMYFILLSEDTDRDRVIRSLANEGINAVFHYVPLHTSPAGKR
jgi:dTDP-4-amino-4,6-dideoxygalactose transaminase